MTGNRLVADVQALSVRQSIKQGACLIPGEVRAFPVVVSQVWGWEEPVPILVDDLARVPTWYARHALSPARELHNLGP